MSGLIFYAWLGRLIPALRSAVCARKKNYSYLFIRTIAGACVGSLFLAALRLNSRPWLSLSTSGAPTDVSPSAAVGPACQYFAAVTGMKELFIGTIAEESRYS